MPRKRSAGRPKLAASERKGELLQVRMPPGLIGSIKKAAKTEGTAVSEVVRTLLEEWLAKRS